MKTTGGIYSEKDEMCPFCEKRRAISGNQIGDYTNAPAACQVCFDKYLRERRKNDPCGPREWDKKTDSQKKETWRMAQRF